MLLPNIAMKIMTRHGVLEPSATYTSVRTKVFARDVACTDLLGGDAQVSTSAECPHGGTAYGILQTGKAVAAPSLVEQADCRITYAEVAASAVDGALPSWQTLLVPLILHQDQIKYVSQSEKVSPGVCCTSSLPVAASRATVAHQSTCSSANDSDNADWPQLRLAIRLARKVCLTWRRQVVPGGHAGPPRVSHAKSPSVMPLPLGPVLPPHCSQICVQFATTAEQTPGRLWRCCTIQRHGTERSMPTVLAGIVCSCMTCQGFTMAAQTRCSGPPYMTRYQIKMAAETRCSGRPDLQAAAGAAGCGRANRRCDARCCTAGGLWC